MFVCEKLWAVHVVVLARGCASSVVNGVQLCSIAFNCVLLLSTAHTCVAHHRAQRTAEQHEELTKLLTSLNLST